MDASTYPRVSRYIKSLPRGLASHPECECKASVYREALAAVPKPIDARGLDPLIADYLVNPMPVSTWVPEVVNTAIFLTMADMYFPTDTAFLDWVGAFSEATFRAPMYRILMAVASPNTLAQGAQRRWRTFHTGTELESVVGPNGTETILRYPENTFDSLSLRATLRAIQSAYRASGARSSVVELVRFTPTEASYRSIWHPERAAAG